MFDRRQQRRVIDRRRGLADQPISRRFGGGKLDDPTRRARPSRPGGNAGRETRGQVRRQRLGSGLQRSRGLIDRDGSSRRFGSTGWNRLL